MSRSGQLRLHGSRYYSGKGTLRIHREVAMTKARESRGRPLRVHLGQRTSQHPDLAVGDLVSNARDLDVAWLDLHSSLALI